MSDAGTRYAWQAIWDTYGTKALTAFKNYRMEGQRRGQAFINVIPLEQSQWLIENGLSPFYEDTDEAVFAAFKAIRERSSGESQ